MICISDYLMIRKSAFNISDSLLLSDESFVKMSLKNQIKRIWSTPGFKEAIAIASIELYKSCANIEKKNSKAIKDIHNSVIKYYIRMCTRSTPFGLFSGFSITKFDVNTKSNNQKFNLKPIYKISEEWLESLISQVLYTTNMIKYLSFKCNKNIDIKKKTISNYFVPGEKKRNTSIHINNNTLNNFILEYLNEERSFNELFYKLKSNKINITENILMNYLKDMVKKGFIITELQKSNFNNINIEKLKYLLRKSETPEVYLNILNDLLWIIEKQSFNVKEYIKIAEESQQLIPNILPLQVDSILNTDVNLNSSIKKEIKEIAEVYYFLNNHWEVSNNYNKDFMEKYGVNVGVNIKNLAYKTKHLGVENNGSIKRKNNLLTDLAFSINREQQENVDISGFYNIKNIDYPTPASFDLYFKIYEDEIGNRTIFPSGNIITNESHKTFGRFLKYFKELNEDLCIDKKTILDTIFPNNIKYGVSFKPIDFKALNVTKTPKVTPENLYFNSFENNNKLDNISVYCNEKGEINIYDTTEKKKVHLLTNNMLNYNSSAPNICRFLLDSSENNYVKCYPINNEDLEKFAYFPRITYKNIVLRLKKWKFKSEKNSYRKIIEAYNYGFMDRFVTLVQFDNFILLDLEADYSKIILKKELKGKVEYIEFEEANHLVNNKSKYGEYEFIVPVNIIDEDRNKESEINLFNEYKDYENRVLTINDGLLYLKIYFILGYSDELLTELKMYFNKKKISNYFFIQYHDPLPHIRLRIISSSENIMENLKIITYLNHLDYVKKIELVDYEREIERYGGINKIETAEEIFKKDSKNALQLIKEKNKEQLAFAVGLNYIISFYEEYKVNEIYNLLKTKLNKDEIYYNNINDNPKIITEMYYHPDYFTLANGILPWIILMRNRQLNEKGNYELEIHELLKGRINRKVINQIDNPGLFSGIAGILYTLSISANDKRYDNLIQGILPYLEKKTYNKIKQCYINKIKKKVNDYDYDLISGLSGILKCYINSSVRKYIHNSEIIHETARCLQSYFNYNDFKNIEDLPFYIKKEKNKYMPTKNGLINFSHSHGIMGILNALNQYYEIFEKKETKRVIEKICEFVINFYSESSYSWLKKFYSDNKKIYDSPNYTWCYGDLIMTQTFYKSAKHIENKSYISISNNFFDNLKDKYELLPSPSLCHGKAGVLLQLLNFKQTNMSELSDIYFEKLMDDYDDNNIYKFRDCEEYRGRRYYIDKNNFLTGSLGIYFVIDLYFGLKDHVKLSDLIM